jgi:hypothetical protein
MLIDVQPVVPQCLCSRVIICLDDHKPARENSYAAFQHAHIYVHFKHGYTLALKQRLGKGQIGHIVRAKKLFHKVNMTIRQQMSRCLTGA